MEGVEPTTFGIHWANIPKIVGSIVVMFRIGIFFSLPSRVKVAVTSQGTIKLPIKSVGIHYLGVMGGHGVG